MDDPGRLIQSLFPFILLIVWAVVAARKKKGKAAATPHGAPRESRPGEQPSPPPTDRVRQTLQDMLREMGLPTEPPPHDLPPAPQPTTSGTVGAPKRPAGVAAKKTLKPASAPLPKAVPAVHEQTAMDLADAAAYVMTASPIGRQPVGPAGSAPPPPAYTIDELQKAVVWSEILQPPVALR